MTTHHSAGNRIEYESPHAEQLRLAELTYQCMDYLAEKGCDLSTVRYYAEPYKADGYWCGGVYHMWIADKG